MSIRRSGATVILTYYAKQVGPGFVRFLGGCPLGGKMNQGGNVGNPDFCGGVVGFIYSPKNQKI